MLPIEQFELLLKSESTGDLELRLLPVAAALSRTLSDTHSRVIQEFATNKIARPARY